MINIFFSLSADTSIIPKCILYFDGVNINQKILNYDLHALALSQQPKLKPNQESEIIHLQPAKQVLEFYVQLDKQKDTIKSLSDKLNSFKSPRVSEVLIGDLVIVKLLNEKMRCTVEMKRSSKLYEVFAVDYGITEDVQLHEMYLISEELAAIPPMVYRCQLKHAAVLSKNKSAVHEFNRLINAHKHQKLCLKVEKVLASGIYVIDLINEVVGEFSKNLTSPSGSPTLRPNQENDLLDDGDDEQVETHSMIYNDDEMSPEKIINKTMIQRGRLSSTGDFISPNISYNQSIIDLSPQKSHYMEKSPRTTFSQVMHRQACSVQPAIHLRLFASPK